MFINFIIPAYNEEQILEKNALKLANFLGLQNYNFDWNLILLVNGSDDNSKNIAKKLEENNKNIKAVIIEEKGRGNALKIFLDRQEADFSLYMDVDLAVSLENINDVVKGLLETQKDLFIGSRLKKGAITDRSFLRELSSRSYVLLSKIIVGHNFTDLQCGFKGIRKDAWKKISPFIEDKAWFFDTELLIWSRIFNLTTQEIPVNWSENRYEKRKSKVKILRDSIIFIKKLLALRKRIRKQRQN